jgi:hypothetical protein
MSRISELNLCVGELRNAAQALSAAADSLTALFSDGGEQPQSASAPEPAVTLEEVRAVLADKSRAGHTDAVRALLHKHGAEKLSKIDPAAYPALLQDAEALKDG